jgi:hypothetical protein
VKRILFELPMASPEETRGAGEQPFDRAQAGAHRVPTQGAGATVERESRGRAEAEAAHGAAQPAAAAPQAGFSPLAEGRFRKELIREGTWVHPTQHFQLTVTRERMRRWVEKFRLLRERGIRIPVPFGHSYDPKDNAGFLEDLVLEGNALFGVLVIPRAEDAGKLGTTVKEVSISINPDFRDGEGRRYGEVIEHIALTTRPLVGGQSDFLPLHLPDGTEAEVWRFSPASVRPRAEAQGQREPERGQAPTAPAAQQERKPEVKEAPAASEVQTRDQSQPGRQAQASQHAPAAPSGHAAHEVQASQEAPAARETQAGHGGQPAGDGQAAGHGQASRQTSVRSQAPALAFARELAELRQSALERELTELLRAGRLTPAMREPARRLLALEGPVSLQLAGGETRLDVAVEVRALLASIPAHALIDLRQRTLAEAPKPVGEMTEERAAQLAEENRRLAHLEPRCEQGGSGGSAS